MVTHEPCPFCGGDVIEGTTCPKSLPCPTCGARSGDSCRRPSGHRADRLHADRIAAAEEADAIGGLSPETLAKIHADQGRLL